MKSEIPMTDVSPAEGLSTRPTTFRLGRALDTGLRWLTEGSAALLVVIEVTLLFCNVFSRYVLNQPIVWGDELASLLFLWLAMLGSVVAMRRGEHMRLTSFIGRLPLEKRAAVGTPSHHHQVLLLSKFRRDCRLYPRRAILVESLPRQ